MSNPFAILSDYNGANEVPQREKVVRKKNKHEPGAGYSSTIKREGRGQSNWGNAIDEAKRPEIVDQQEGEQQENVENAEPKVVYEAAFKYFDSDDEDETPKIHREGKRVVNIPEQYASMVVEKKSKSVEVRTYIDDEPEAIETGFLSTAEAIRQRQNARRSGYNNNRNVGGRKPNGQRKPQDRAPRAAPPRNNAPKPAAPAQGENAQEKKPRSKPRDQRPGNVQHQRQVGAGKKQSNLSLKNFPKLQ